MSRGRTPWFAWIALFLSVLGIVFLRAPEMVLAPSLLWDEGCKVFANFYEHREAAQILRFKSGYLPLIGNLIGYAAVRLPTRIIPYAFVGSAVLITSVTYCLFFARAFRRWFPSDLDRALMCLVFALAPISSCQLVTTSDYSIWNLLAALILLTVWLPSEKGAGDTCTALSATSLSGRTRSPLLSRRSCSGGLSSTRKIGPSTGFCFSICWCTRSLASLALLAHTDCGTTAQAFLFK